MKHKGRTKGQLANELFAMRRRIAELELLEAKHARIQEELQEERKFISAILDAGDALIIVLDREGRIVFFNQACQKTTGYHLDEVKGRYIWDKILLPEEADLIRKQIETMLFDRVPFKQEYQLVTREGRRRLIAWSMTTFQNRKGEIEFIIGMGIDITERKQAEIKLAQEAENLARSNAELEQFAYVASHDLQEPLRMVASYVQLLERRYRGKLDADAEDFIAFAVDGATRMQQLINDLLMLSRVGTQGKEMQETDCEEVAASALANLKQMIDESGAVVTCTPLPKVIGDHSQLVLLLQNLIGNAIKFHGQRPPEIKITAESGENQWVFSVSDRGIGIDPQYFDRIFVIFQRLHPRTEYGGTGIGLAICKKIVERHGGRIWVESEPGKGSTFYFTIPKREGESNCLTEDTVNPWKSC